jgi:hypothetical protein
MAKAIDNKFTDSLEDLGNGEIRFHMLIGRLVVCTSAVSAPRNIQEFKGGTESSRTSASLLIWPFVLR